MNRHIIPEIASSVLVLLFAYTGLSKLFDYGSFKAQLSISPYLHFISTMLAWLLPALELIISLLLTISTTRLSGLYCSFILLMLFTVYIMLLLLSGKHLTCTCGGIIKELSWKQHLVFNLFFVTVALTGIKKAKKTIIRKAIRHRMA
jgi:uncharacterized membrane protein YphA (DoxX/SURF4 family)